MKIFRFCFTIESIASLWQTTFIRMNQQRQFFIFLLQYCLEKNMFFRFMYKIIKKNKYFVVL
jgi:hypothetical protein